MRSAGVLHSAGGVFTQSAAAQLCLGDVHFRRNYRNRVSGRNRRYLPLFPLSDIPEFCAASAFDPGAGSHVSG